MFFFLKITHIFLLKVQERMEFTPGEHQLIDHILAAHQKCTIPLEEAKKFVCVSKQRPYN